MKTIALVILFAGFCALANAEYLFEDEQRGERDCKPNVELVKFCRKLREREGKGEEGMPKEGEGNEAEKPEQSDEELLDNAEEHLAEEKGRGREHLKILLKCKNMVGDGKRKCLQKLCSRRCRPRVNPMKPCRKDKEEKGEGQKPEGHRRPRLNLAKICRELKERQEKGEGEKPEDDEQLDNAKEHLAEGKDKEEKGEGQKPEGHRRPRLNLAKICREFKERQEKGEEERPEDDEQLDNAKEHVAEGKDKEEKGEGQKPEGHRRPHFNLTKMCRRLKERQEKGEEQQPEDDEQLDNAKEHLAEGKGHGKKVLKILRQCRKLESDKKRRCLKKLCSLIKRRGRKHPEAPGPSEEQEE